MDLRDEATQQVGAIRYANYSQFLQGVEGLRGLRLGIVVQGTQNIYLIQCVEILER